MKTSLKFIKEHREWLLLPLFVALMVLAIHGCYWLSGRKPIDDPGELVSLCFRAIALAFALAFTGFIKSHEKLNRATEHTATRDVALSRIWTGVLLFGCYWCLTH